MVKHSSLFFPTISDEENSYMKMTHCTDVVKGFSSLIMEQNKLDRLFFAIFSVLPMPIEEGTAKLRIQQTNNRKYLFTNALTYFPRNQ